MRYTSARLATNMIEESYLSLLEVVGRDEGVEVGETTVHAVPTTLFNDAVGKRVLRG